MKKLKEQLGDSEVKDFAIHINKDTVEKWTEMYPIEDNESISEYVERVAYFDATGSKLPLVEKRATGAGELKAVMAKAASKGISKKELAQMVAKILDLKEE